ncbi:SRPBCC domain-containing protein [Nakamurella sp. YIM 132087]|uniref:SRPBCC domain-containing protein n=1 Tax=Nakamurella alba TaxID=2665158 RepID=A0A7K1FM94_9ACTN|nr:SRPBCC domain-containing protein [Nakamurella alba]MTD15275.1 SRPBCC domain-containing protein [Nakamurella alba]
MTGKRFDIARTFDVEGTPEQVFDAVTTNVGGWLWPMEFEPRVGGAAAFGGVVTVWDPPHHFVTRVDGEDGWFNQLEHEISARPGGATVRYVHSGVITEDWDTQYDGADQHTDFYLHTLRQYVQHFAGRTVSYSEATAPASSQNPEGLRTLLLALGIGDGVQQGDRIQLALPAVGVVVDVEVDHRNHAFIGLRTDDALIRIFGRNFFGAPVAVTVHRFPDADADGPTAEAVSAAWQQRLDEIYA